MKKVGLVCCSNGERPESSAIHEQLTQVLAAHGMETVLSPCLYARDGVSSGTEAERADVLNRMFRDSDIEEIFDVSGGDLANEVLNHLDYSAVASSKARLWGYSDLTTVLNGIYAKTGRTGILYQIKNLVGPCGESQQSDFFSQGQQELFRLPHRFLRGERMEGTLVGGNIRCLLKLAGTEYFPNTEGKILLLEANSGRVPQMTTYLSQLNQMGVFRNVSGILLGTFTQMEREGCSPSMEQLVLNRVDAQIPVVKTERVGHGPDARAVMIGETYRFER